MSRKPLGKLLAVIEDPRSFAQKLDMHVYFHPLQLDYIEFNWQFTSRVSPQNVDRTCSYDRPDVYVPEYIRAHRSWKQYRDNENLWSNVRYMTLYIFEHYDIVVSYRNSPVRAIVAWFSADASYGTYETLKSHQDLLRIFQAMKKGYLP